MRELLPLLVAGLTPFAVLALIVTGVSVSLVAWQPPVLQATQFGTANSENGVTAIASDPTGVYAGGFVGYLNNPNPTYLFVNKYSLDGHQTWTQRFGDPNFSSIQGMSVGLDGLYVVGYLFTSSTNGSAFLRKYDFKGNSLWSLNISGPVGVSTSANYLYVVGGYNSSRFYMDEYGFGGNLVWTRLFGNFSDRVSVSTVSGEIYVAYDDSLGNGHIQAFDPNSTLLWTQSCSCVPMGITGDGTGVYIVGTIQTARLVPPDGFLTKYDLNGTQLWTTKVTPPAGNLALVGASELRASAYSSAIYVTETTGDERGTVMKYDSNGGHIWSLVLPWPTGTLYAPVAVLTLQDGSVYVGGSQGSAFIAEISETSSLIFFGINPPFSFGLLGIMVAASVVSIIWFRKRWKSRGKRPGTNPSPRLKNIPTDLLPLIQVGNNAPEGGSATIAVQCMFQ